MRFIIKILSIICIASPVFGETLIEVKDGVVYVDGKESEYAPVKDPDEDGWYFAIKESWGYVLARYDRETCKTTELGSSGVPLGTVFSGRSLVIEDEDRLIVINEDTHGTEGIAGGRPVAFFGGNSQVYLRYGTIHIGNLYEGKSSKIRFDLGKGGPYEEVYFYPVSLKEIYFRVLRSDGGEESYLIKAEKGGFEVTPIEGFELSLEEENSFWYFGSKKQ